MINGPKGYRLDKTANLDHLPKIKGYDFSKKFDLDKFLKAYSTTGFQATNLGQAIHTIKAMIREKATIYLVFTSNMVSSGVREAIRYLIEKKIVHVLVTSAGGIEEDFIKAIKPFNLGSFESNGKYLFEEGINRIGNIFVTNDRYTYFEKAFNPILDEAYKIQKKQGPICASDLIDLMGKNMDSKESILYWAHKNKIPFYCPAPTDGALGDLIYFMKQRNKDFMLDVAEDMHRIVNQSINAKKTGLIILGAGTAKHYALNAQIFREGCDYAVYINTASEFDGSDSGAKTDEAITWGKIKANAPQVKVHGDATILFPLILAGVLSDTK